MVNQNNIKQMKEYAEVQGYEFKQSPKSVEVHLCGNRIHRDKFYNLREAVEWAHSQIWEV